MSEGAGDATSCHRLQPDDHHHGQAQPLRKKLRHESQPKARDNGGNQGRVMRHGLLRPGQTSAMGLAILREGPCADGLTDMV